MTRKASISHEDAIIEELRKDPDYAAEYLRAALEESDEPKVLLVALRHIAKAQGMQIDALDPASAIDTSLSE